MLPLVDSKKSEGVARIEGTDAFTAISVELIT